MMRLLVPKSMPQPTGAAPWASRRGRRAAGVAPRATRRGRREGEDVTQVRSGSGFGL